MSIGEKTATATVTSKEEEKIKELGKEDMKDMALVLPELIRQYNEMNITLVNDLILIALVTKRTTDSGIIKSVSETSKEMREERAKNFHYVVDYDKDSQFPLVKNLAQGKRIMLLEDAFKVHLVEPIVVKGKDSGGKEFEMRFEYLYGSWMHGIIGVTDGIIDVTNGI